MHCEEVFRGMEYSFLRVHLRDPADEMIRQYSSGGRYVINHKIHLMAMAQRRAEQDPLLSRLLAIP